MGALQDTHREIDEKLNKGMLAGARKKDPARRASSAQARREGTFAPGKALPLAEAPEPEVYTYNSLVPRTRSSHHNCRESDCELRVQSGTGIIGLLVSFDSEVRMRTCRKGVRTSESGH